MNTGRVMVIDNFADEWRKIENERAALAAERKRLDAARVEMEQTLRTELNRMQERNRAILAEIAKLERELLRCQAQMAGRDAPMLQ
jgi:peptidoglycan hydrolase CwlO-like protein